LILTLCEVAFGFSSLIIRVGRDYRDRASAGGLIVSALFECESAPNLAPSRIVTQASDTLSEFAILDEYDRRPRVTPDRTPKTIADQELALAGSASPKRQFNKR
jgi:hypothetical protein